MAQIDDVVLTHAHLDHLLALPLLADVVLPSRMMAQGHGPARGAIRVHGLPHTLEALRTHLFNGILWPDFLRMPSEASPLLTLHPHAVGDRFAVGTGTEARTLWLLPAVHPIPACGVAVDTADGWWVFSGDSGTNPEGHALLQNEQLAHLVIDVSFPDAQAALAERSGHLCPQTLDATLRWVPDAVPVHLTHLKPGLEAWILDEVQALNAPHRIEPLRTGQRFEMRARDGGVPASP
jgi:ribonuclease BN (tRNA processing enzyme)